MANAFGSGGCSYNPTDRVTHLADRTPETDRRHTARTHSGAADAGGPVRRTVASVSSMILGSSRPPTHCARPRPRRATGAPLRGGTREDRAWTRPSASTAANCGRAPLRGKSDE